MIRQLIVVDVETNGLDPSRHSTVEVAWWNLTTDERGWFIPPHDVSTVLAAADIEALRVNRYIDRIPGQPQDRNRFAMLRLWQQFAGSLDDYEEPIARHTLGGSNPAFDAQFVAKMFRDDRDDSTDGLDPTPWHHRLWDLSAYAAGVLGLDELPGLSTVCEHLGVPAPDHTAEGDVTATGLCFRALQQLADARPSTPVTGADS